MVNRSRVRIALLAVLALAACGGEEPPLPAIGGPPDRDGLSSLRRFALDRVLDARVASGARAGFVALVARRGRIVYARTTGWADLEAGTPMTLDTRFHLASMSKAITAVAALVLVDEGRLDLEAPLSDFVPAFKAATVVTGTDDAVDFETDFLDEPIRIRHLLTFTSGIGGYAETDDPETIEAALSWRWTTQQRACRHRGVPINSAALKHVARRAPACLNKFELQGVLLNLPTRPRLRGQGWQSSK